MAVMKRIMIIKVRVVEEMERKLRRMFWCGDKKKDRGDVRNDPCELFHAKGLRLPALACAYSLVRTSLKMKKRK